MKDRPTTRRYMRVTYRSRSPGFGKERWGTLITTTGRIGPLAGRGAAAERTAGTAPLLPRSFQASIRRRRLAGIRTGSPVSV
jgi:hypothetical protein